MVVSLLDVEKSPNVMLWSVFEFCSRRVPNLILFSEDLVSCLGILDVEMSKSMNDSCGSIFTPLFRGAGMYLVKRKRDRIFK